VERYGPARRKIRDRIDKGVRRGQRAANAAADGSFATEAAFIRKRVADVRELHGHWVRDGKGRGAAKRVQDAAAELWTDKMEEEVNFQKAKRQKRLVDAARENQVLPKERDTGLDVAVRAAVGREAAAHVRGGCLPLSSHQTRAAARFRRRRPTRSGMPSGWSGRRCSAGI